MKRGEEGRKAALLVGYQEDFEVLSIDVHEDATGRTRVSLELAPIYEVETVTPQQILGAASRPHPISLEEPHGD